MKKYLLLLIAVLISSNLFAGNYESKFSAYTKAKISLSNEYLKDNNYLLKTAKIDYPYSVDNGRLYIDVLVQISTEKAISELNAIGVKVLSRAGNILALSVAADKIESIASLQSVNTIQASQRRTIRMDKSKAAINAEEVKVDNGITPSNIIGGEGVIVGIFDTGIDVSHPDFLNENGSRILKLWDMSDNSGIGAPQGYDYGREYTKAEIDSSPETIAERDYGAHGTHVAGTAAGNGNADAKFRGIAYNADIIVVKGFRDNETSNFDDPDIIAGCSYIFSEANKLGKPAVINLSLGTMIGSHDGKDLLSIALSSLVGKGNIIVASAGNEGEMPIHAGGDVAAGDYVEFPIFPQNVCEIFENFCPDIPDFFMTAGDMWYSAGIIDSVTIAAYGMVQGGFEVVASKTISINDMVENQPFFDGTGKTIALMSFMSNPMVPTNNSGNFMVQIHNGGMAELVVADYLWTIAAKVTKDGNMHIWAAIPLPDGFPFLPLIGTSYFSGNNYMTHGSPGDGDSIISVGSFVTKNSWIDKNGQPQTDDFAVIGDASSFSSIGPSRDGRIIPIMSAPGQVIFATLSTDATEMDESSILEGGYYAGMSGTSMASPHVAGAVALMLQINPELRYSDVVDILAKTAHRDEFTGEERNVSFGYGKINVQAAINYMLTGTSVEYILANDVKVYPNPANNYVTLELGEEFQNATLNIYSINGSRVDGNFSYQFIPNGNNSTIQLDVASLQNGVYNAECIFENKVAKFRFVVSKH